MARIAFVLLCHKDPEGIVAQAGRLTAGGDCVAIHFDGRSPAADFARLREGLADNPGVVFARRRVNCGWGEWSLVEATLEAVRAAADAFPDATHFYMLSGDCEAIKSAEYAHRFLDAEEADYIESFDFFESDWIKTGIKEERLIYRHLFNERRRKRLFYASLEAQRRLGLTRRIPADLRIMIGSQWWCLRRRTVEALLDFIDRRRDVVRFFRTTWIPDETFFQTLVRHLVPERELRSRTLTFLMFTDYGMPVTFHNDHYDLLLAQDYLFARKISPHATELKARLGAVYASGRTDFEVSNEGRRLYAFLAGRGREGRRFAPRFWEREASLGRERELMIVACKKWHVGKRLLERVRQVTNTPTIAYLFNEENTPLPDLGGVETTLTKRNRHRRALVKMLFDYYGTDRLVFCLDPSDIATIDDFYADRCVTKLLEIDCRFSEDYLAGHARRVGLAGDRTPGEVLARLLPTIRYDIQFESERIRDRGFPRHWRLREGASPEENAPPLAAFLDIPEAKAREIAATDHLFTD
jgi:hypothetical protein